MNNYFIGIKDNKEDVRANIHSIGHLIRENLGKTKESEEILALFEKGVGKVEEGLKLWEEFYRSKDLRKYGPSLRTAWRRTRDLLKEGRVKIFKEI